MAKRIRIKKGTTQGASFIDADSGEYGKPRGNDTTRRYRDGTSAAKNHGKHYGYKQQTLTNEIKIIEKLFVTPANVHDSMIDLSWYFSAFFVLLKFIMSMKLGFYFYKMA